MGGFVRLEKNGRIATMTLDKPERMNAIGDFDDCADFVAALAEVNDDPEISVGILTGTGRAFSAGGNLQAMKDRTGIGPREMPADTRVVYRRGVQRIPRAFQDCEVPLIAAVNGHAIGLGCDLACFCDIRIASDAAKFGSTFVKVGIVPGDGGAWVLPRAVGYSKACEMLFTGDVMTADQALACGLVSQVVPADRLLEEANALAARIAANPAKALRLAKRLMTEAQNMRLSEVLEMSAAFQALSHETADHREAVDAFLEKRAPVFTGG